MTMSDTRPRNSHETVPNNLDCMAISFFRVVKGPSENPPMPDFFKPRIDYQSYYKFYILSMHLCKESSTLLTKFTKEKGLANV